MTAQKEHIQILIAEIDSVLQRTNPRLPWVMSGEVAQQRQVLERVRNFLVSLQQSFPTQDGLGQSAYGAGAFGGETQADATPYEMMQAILRDVSYLRTNLTATALNPPPLSQPQLTAELMQVLMSRLQENLAQQIAQTLEHLRQQQAAAPYGTSAALPGGMLPSVNSAPQYEQLQMLRSRSDQMLVNLDATLNVVFESLQRNIQAYQESLSQGVERMYSMGQQSEQTFRVLIDQLAQQLKQEATAYLQSPPPAPVPSLPANPSEPMPLSPPPTTAALAQSIAPPPDPSPSGVTSPPAPHPAAANPSFPYAGAELLSSDFSGTDLTTPTTTESLFSTASPSSETPLDSAIESWLQSISAMNLGPETPTFDPVNAELPPLDLSDLELGTVAVPESKTRSAIAPSPDPPLPLAPSDEDDTAEIDAALKLLEELSAELETSAGALSLDDAEAQLEQMLSSPPVDDSSLPALTLPEDARDELDEFYQSLFGSEIEVANPATEATSASMTGAPATPVTEITSAPIAAVDSMPPAEVPSDMAIPALELPSDLFEFPATLTAEATDEPEAAFLELPADLFEPEFPAASAAIAASLPTEPLLDLDDMGSLSDLFQSVAPEATRSIPIDPPQLSQPSTGVAEPSSSDGPALFLTDDLFGHVAPTEVSDDQFTRAVPEESLLPDAVQAESQVNLELDDLTLNSLSEDLSSLEGSFEQAALPTAADHQVSLPALTLDEFAADVVSSETATPSDPRPFYQASPEITNLSIEGFAELFGDANSPAVSPSSLNLPISTSEPLPFTLEGTSNLFEEPISSPPAAPLPETIRDQLEEPVPSPPAAPVPELEPLSGTGGANPSPFTLEGMDDLFGDAPSLNRANREAPSVNREASSPVTPTILPANAPVVTPIEPEVTQEEVFTLEGMDDLFGSLPTNPAAPPPLTSNPVPPRREIPPFRPELFNPDDVDVVENLPPFKLERLDNLFTDAATPSLEGSAIAPPVEPPISPTSPLSENGDHPGDNLNITIDSLFTPPAASVVTPAQSTQKKKPS